MIAIIDYGMGNLRSVSNSLAKIDCEHKVTNKKQDLLDADGLILPGVGAFYDCMENLRKADLIDAIQTCAQAGKPLLGICLGMQALFEKGYEVQACQGLGLLKGNVCLMEDDSVKIPHIGWNSLEQVRPDEILDGIDHQVFTYFVHSYRACDYEEEDLVAYCCYGSLKIPAYVRKGNVLGMQYHPEKSGEDGLKMLMKFKEMCL